MKQIIPFVKDLFLDTNIYDVTSIAMEHNLKIENEDSIVGNFIISGKYKENNIVLNEESFEEEILFDITLDDKYESEKVEIDIDNFYYEIIDNKYIRVHIDVLLDNLVYKKQERCIEDETKEDITYEEEKQEKIVLEEKKEEIIEMQDILDNKVDKEKNNLNSIDNNLINNEDQYIMYKVHIIREEETIETIKEKYNITKEELEKYNEIENITLGSKIIIPLNNE